MKQTVETLTIRGEVGSKEFNGRMRALAKRQAQSYIKTAEKLLVGGLPTDQLIRVTEKLARLKEQF